MISLGYLLIFDEKIQFTK